MSNETSKTIDLFIRKYTGCNDFSIEEVVQELWSGYGDILRMTLEGADHSSVILKKVDFATAAAQPRAWNSSNSHQRKRKSYEVEWNWYANFSKHQSIARMPDYLGSMDLDGIKLLLLEDLDAAGFPIRKTRLTINEIKTCLTWLANFHAFNLGKKGNGLWDIGTYWHLDTRPDEFEAMADGKLKDAAVSIDRVLNGASHQSFVHGDAKLANFCFSEDGRNVAAVDFQYVGKGAGIKDVAYFLSSCLSSDQCFEYEEKLLNHYFNRLSASIGQSNDLKDVIDEWRWLYPYAWADFERFLEGWSPGHFKIHDYGRTQVDIVLKQL